MRGYTQTLWRRLRFTPARDWLRGRLTGRFDVVHFIEQAELPTLIHTLICNVVRRTRLWRIEKLDVAVELIAHFQDGLASGQSADDLVERFGHTKQTAKLIRRSKKRNRPMWWKASRRCMQGFGVFVVLYVLAGVMLMLDHPNPTVDYLAKINAPALAVPEGERAWPIYREAFIEYQFYTLDLAPLYVNNRKHNMRSVRPSDAEWPNVVAFLDKYSGLLDAIRRGGSKSGLGLTVGYEGHWTGDDALALYGPDYEPSQPQPVDRADALANYSLISVLLPELGHMRKMARLMDADTRLAVQQDDSPRIVANTRAMVGLARQSRENPTLIADLVAQSISMMMVQQVNDILQQHPEILTDEHLTQLAHLVGSLDDMRSPNFEAERWMMEDFFQRIYGSSGRVTYDGIRMMKSMGGGLDFEQTSVQGVLLDHDYITMAATPAAAALIAPRDEMSQQHQRLMDIIGDDIRRPLRKMYLNNSRVDTQIRTWQMSHLDRTRYFPLILLMPAMDAAGRSYRVRAFAREALLVAIGTELYQRDHGQYPDTIYELVPQYLPTVPVDESAETGTLLLKVTGDRIIVYGRGLDGDDDGGVAPPDYRWPRLAETSGGGDWVLYPAPIPDDEK